MAIVGSEDILKKISSQIDSQFPGFIREEGPQFVSFMKAYFEYMEQDGNPINAIRSLKDNLDIDRTVDSFIEYFRKEFMINIPKDVLADKRLLAKHIRQFYRARGSQESYRFLFRALFDTELDFYYPGDDILRASDGRWVQETKLRVGQPQTINPTQFEGKNVRGVTSGAVALVQRVTSTIAAGLVLHDMVVENVTGSFIDNERVVDAAGNYVTVSAQVGSLIDITVVDGGAYHNLNDQIEIGGAGSTESATAIVTETDNKQAVELRITNSGSGYTRDNTKVVITGGSGTGFAAKITSWANQPIPTTLGVDTIQALKNVRLDTGRFFVDTGANTATVRSKLTGTVKLSSGSNTVIGQGTSFTEQLNVGDIVRVKGSANTLRVHSISSAQTFISAIRPLVTISTGAAAYNGIAAANIYSTLATALRYSATNYFAINAIAIINPGYGYTTLPTITIVDSETSPLNVDDTYGSFIGRNAVVSVSNAPGAIKKLRVINPGQNFNRFDQTDLLNTTQGNSAIIKTFASANVSGGSANRYQLRHTTFSGSAIPIPSGIVTFPGRYTDTKGFLSGNNKLQDNYYYQEFSYVLRVSEVLDKYREVVKRVLHPAGTKQFNELLITSSASQITVVGVTISNIQLLDHVETLSISDAVVGRKITSAVIAETITATDSMPAAFTTKNAGVSETVSSTDSIVGLNIASGVITESATTTDSVAGTYNSVALTSGTESVTATDSANGGRLISATSGTESITSTDSVVGTYRSVNLTSGTESVTSTESVVGAKVTSATTETESVTSTDSVVGAKVINTTTGTESATTTDSVVGTYNSVALTSGTESASTTDSVVGTYNSVTLTSGTESVTSTDSVAIGKIISATTGTESATTTDSVAGTYNSVALTSGTETITSTDSVVGRSVTSAAITELSGAITPYAATLISVYQTSNISVLVTPFLNIDDTVNRS
jgi:hypothetical protein